MSKRRGLLGFLGILVALLPACEGDEPGPRPPHASQVAEAERTGFPAFLSNPLGMRFGLIPAGVFQMGSPAEEAGREQGESLHEVHVLRAFYVQTTEVTNGQFRRFRTEHSSGTTADGATLDRDDQPVVNVSHADAVAFAAWLSEQDPRFVYRLPTEAEWEFAARAGASSPFAVGAEVSAADATVVCAEGAAPPGTSTRIASHPPNAWGLHDMHGNAAEWCHDRFGEYPLWRMDNPQGASRGTERVVRGGSWAQEASKARSAARAHLPPDHRCGTVGFRLAFGLGYGRTEFGRHRVHVRTVDPTVSEGAECDRPGWPMYMISVVDRLTDRVNQIADPRWTLLKQPSPITLNLAPGIYYVFCYRMEGETRVRSIEMKFHVPGSDEILCPIPRKYQQNPQ